MKQRPPLVPPLVPFEVDLLEEKTAQILGLGPGEAGVL
jgi:hypothetical protein